MPDPDRQGGGGLGKDQILPLQFEGRTKHSTTIAAGGERQMARLLIDDCLKIAEGRSRWLCMDCTDDTYASEEYYMLRPGLWRSINHRIDGALVHPDPTFEIPRPSRLVRWQLQWGSRWMPCRLAARTLPFANGCPSPTAEIGPAQSPTVAPLALPLRFKSLGLDSHVGPDLRDPLRLFLESREFLAGKHQVGRQRRLARLAGRDSSVEHREATCRAPESG